MSPGARLVPLIRGYQRFVSPFLPRACRFAPSCSEYARQALLQHGVVRGSWLAARRLVRCHPFHPGGYDPLPLARGSKSAGDTLRTWKET
ncbi:MAG: membrane protein insertion efficiency factor YidD [Candidatus Methylomirabilales bacterium]